MTQIEHPYCELMLDLSLTDQLEGNYGSESVACSTREY